jgi:peptidoglycan/xylan/chitin deacetylase (PgdA/CDA1 family)
MRATRPGAPILCYHNVVTSRDVPGDRGLHLPLERFAEQVQWLVTHFTVLPLTELAARASAGKNVRGCTAITFDDAYVGVVRNALPLLASSQLPCTIFATGCGSAHPTPFWWDWPSVGPRAAEPAIRDRLLIVLQGDPSRIAEEFGGPPVSVPDEYLPASWTQLRAVAGPLVDIGGHSMTHRTLTTLDAAVLAAECEDSRRSIVEAMGGESPVGFAYPYGLWDVRVARAVRDAGFAFGVTLGSIDLAAGQDTFALPRINVPADVSIDAFISWVSGLAHWRRALRPASS